VIMARHPYGSWFDQGSTESRPSAQLDAAAEVRGVAQVANLLYRRLLVGECEAERQCHTILTSRRLAACETADSAVCATLLLPTSER
jgi:hypothetical protein